MSANIVTIKLNNSKEIPILGVDLQQGFENEIFERVQTAIDSGYKLFNCANIPSMEEALGSALHAKLSEKLTRKDLFIICKIQNPTPALVKSSFFQKLQHLKLFYIDLLLIEFCANNVTGSTSSDTNYIETWKIMENLYRQKLIQALGIANSTTHQLEKILNVATVIPQIIQIECHPLLNQKSLREFCEKHGVRVCSYQTFGSFSKLLNDNRIQEIAARYEKTEAQILIKYNLQLGNVTLLPFLENKEIGKNQFDFYLAPEDMNYINSFDCKKKNIF